MASISNSVAGKFSINLVACAIEQSPMAYPLGALCILTALESDVRTKDATNVSLSHYLADTHDPVMAAKAVAKTGSDLVGLSMYLYNRDWFNRFIPAFKQLCPDTIVYAGGPEAGAKAQELLDMGLSFIVLGEGEETVALAVSQLLAGQDPQGPGIQTNSTALAHAVYPLDLSTLASPLLTGTAIPSDYEGVLWEMTRGCPYHCAFCFESRGSRSVRTYPDERIEAELELLIAHEVKHVFVLDPTFNMDRKRTVHMLTLLRDHSPSDMHFTFEVRAELLDKQTAQLFGQFHCSLQIGLQSCNAAVLNGIGRKFDPELFANKVALLNTHGVVFGLDLIIGLPGDTLESFRDSIDYAIGCKPSNLDIFLLALLPGTQLAEDAKALHLVYQEESPYLLIGSPTMKSADIAVALRLKDACDQFYTQGQAVMWFHAACSGLGFRPVELLEAFSIYLEECPIEEDEDIFAVQDRFIQTLYHEKDKQDLLPALLSYMELHQGIAHLQESGESPVVYLQYDSDLLAQLDSTSLADFSRTYPPSEEPHPYWIFVDDGILYVEKMEG